MLATGSSEVESVIYAYASCWMASSAIAQTAIVVCIIDMIQPVYIHVYVCCLQADVCGVQDPLKTYYTHTSTCTCNMYAYMLMSHVYMCMFFSIT